MSKSNKHKIAELHRKADKERKAKEDIYNIARNALKSYIQVTEIAGRMLDALKEEYEKEIKQHIRFEAQILDRYRAFINEERYLKVISFREYLERRLSGKFLTVLIAKVFKNSYRERFENEWELFNELSKHYNEHNIPVDHAKEIQRYHIIQDIISDVKVPESVMLHKYNLQKAELMTIIDGIQKEIRGLIIE